MFLDRVAGGMVERALTDPEYYEQVARPLLYRLALGDPERAHRIAFWTLNRAQESVARVGERLHGQDLAVHLFGKEAVPIGTAAGFDKDCDALAPLGALFGFQEVGTVVLRKRRGNKQPRVHVDADARTMYNAQGFPSQGLRHARRKLAAYREAGGDGLVFASVCGLPEGPSDITTAREELAELVRGLAPYVDGFVWNPYSPNTEALSRLRTPAEFKVAAQILAEHAPGKPRLVKVGPHRPYERGWRLGLIEAYLSAGGTGVVAVNTWPVQRSQVPAGEWGYAHAGLSGRPLYDPAKQAVADVRAEFPNATIIGVGGVGARGPRDAWELLEAGADGVELFTACTIRGFGVLAEQQSGIRAGLRAAGYRALAEYLGARNGGRGTNV